MRNHNDRIIVLNVIITKFFAIIDENEDLRFQKIKNLINYLLVEIHKNINTRFKILIILIHVIYLLINIRFKYIDLDFLIITISFKRLIFKKRDITTQTNLIYKTQMISFQFRNIKITRYVILKTN